MRGCNKIKDTGLYVGDSEQNRDRKRKGGEEGETIDDGWENNGKDV